MSVFISLKAACFTGKGSNLHLSQYSLIPMTILIVVVVGVLFSIPNVEMYKIVIVIL